LLKKKQKQGKSRDARATRRVERENRPNRQAPAKLPEPDLTERFRAEEIIHKPMEFRDSFCWVLLGPLHHHPSIALGSMLVHMLPLFALIGRMNVLEVMFAQQQNQ